MVETLNTAPISGNSVVRTVEVNNKFLVRYSFGVGMFDIETWNKAIEAAALIVEPNPHVEEERDCKSVADQVRSLKKFY